MEKTFDKLFDKFTKASNEISKFMEEDLVSILSQHNNMFELELNDVFVSLQNADYAEFDELDLVQTIYIEDNILWVGSCVDNKFNDLSISEQLAVYTEVKKYFEQH